MRIRDYGDEIKIEERPHSIDFYIKGEKVNISKGSKIVEIIKALEKMNKWGGQNVNFRI